MERKMIVDGATYEAQKFQKGHLVPACGGTETPFKTRSGITVLYCWHTGNGKHYYVNVETDLILSQEEVNAIFETH